MRGSEVLQAHAGIVASEAAYHYWLEGRATRMASLSDYAQLQLRFVDSVQRRYEVIRPIILIGDRTTAQRAEETQLHPETIRELTRRFRHQGMLGLFPEHTEIITPRRGQAVPAAVVEELARLKALYDGFGYRELARILLHKTHERIDDKTVKKLWQQSPLPMQGELPLPTYHSHPHRYQGRLEVIKLYYQGWTKRSISRFLHVSRPTVDRWIRRFEAEHFAGLQGHKPGPKSPRKVWFPIMVEVYHLQKAHPDAGEFRIWSLLAREDLSVRTVGRVMALNRQVYDDIPHQRKAETKHPPQPHPYKATRPHQYWFIDGRMMDFALAGVRWWSIILLEGYSRTILAGAVAPSEASWVALMVLYTACLRYGVPEFLISDSGGAFTSNEFKRVCRRLGLEHKPIESTRGESYLNWMETHFNVQRRLFDYQFSLTTTLEEFERVHQTFIEIYNTTAHQGLLQDQFDPPIPIQVLSEAKGRIYTQEELARKFSRALFPRTTNRYGCVTLHSYHFYVEAGLPQTRVFLWVYGEQLRAVLDHVVLAEYHCRYDWREHKVTDIRHGVFYATRYVSPQGVLVPLTPQESLVLYRPKSRARQAQLPCPAQQLWLFELVQMA
jgi:transposase InsO family protein